MTSESSSRCAPKDCCSTDLPGATLIERAGSDSSEQDRTDTGTVRRPLSCAQCGNDPNALVRAFKAGMQAAAWDTYADNVRASELKADLEQQWHAHVRRYGE